VFAEIGRTPARKKCEGMDGLLEEGKEDSGHGGDPNVKDAAVIAAAQRVEHYEIAGYGCLRTWSEILGYDEATRLLEQTLDEEKEADELLTEIASNINPEAAEEPPAERRTANRSPDREPGDLATARYAVDEDAFFTRTKIRLGLKCGNSS
jgi:ferritin-like metal-binding protein YciE